MSLYTLSDPHLSLSCDKPMDVFGGKWNGYTEKIKENLSELSDDDTVVMQGDISWGMSLDEAKADLELLNSLPGRKILGKGNHDYWWNTLNKMEIFKKENGFSKIDFLFNNAYIAEGVAICGSRGWYLDAEVKGCDNRKIILRECGRLDTSIKCAKKLSEESGISASPVVFTHYPAVYGDYVCNEIVDVLKSHGIEKCYYGHLHGVDKSRLVEEYAGVKFVLSSADFLDFKPLKII